MSTDTETTETTETIADKFGVTATVESIAARDDLGDGWSRDARHFAVTLHRGADSMTCQFSQGSAWTTEPTAGEVLCSLVSDASYLEDSGDSFTVETVRAIDRNTAALRAMFTDDEWEVLADDASQV